MTLLLSKTGGALTLLNQLPADTDADTYIAAVEGATGDNQALEADVKFAIKNFVLCCKQDGIWDAMKACCILAGARTLNGALKPLKGTAPTNNNFVSGDYNRKTGLVGNGSTKYLDTNRAGNADPQDSFSCTVNLNSVNTSGAAGFYAGNGGGSTGATNLGRGISGSATEHFTRCRSTVNSSISGAMGANPPATGFFGVSRTNSNGYDARTGAVNYPKVATSETRPTNNYFIFCRNNGSGSPEFYTNARLSFYSIGESLDLALLDARVTDLMNAFEAAIP